MPPPEVRDGGSRDLERSEERFRLLVDSVLDYAIFLLDAEGRVQSWNSGAERLNGYEAAEIVGRPFAEFYPEDDRRAGLPDQLLQQARRDGRVWHSGWRVRGFARLLHEDPLSDAERHRLAERIGSNAGTTAGPHRTTSGPGPCSSPATSSWSWSRSSSAGSSATSWTTLRPRSRTGGSASAGDAVTVPADRQGIERVARNLLINAARHTMPGGSILVEVRQEPNLVTVTVEDDGEGLEEELLPRVFDRFERGSNGGTGLGLAIVKEYIELHGGEVWAESPEGRGASFSFTLPLASATG